jgi:hypothetical protein
MEKLQGLHVVSAERHHGGVLITFSNDKAAVYGPTLLYSCFAQADEFLESDSGTQEAQSANYAVPSMGW